jgi:hypothetical protein
MKFNLRSIQGCASPTGRQTRFWTSSGRTRMGPEDTPAIPWCAGRAARHSHSVPQSTPSGLTTRMLARAADVMVSFERSRAVPLPGARGGDRHARAGRLPVSAAEARERAGLGTTPLGSLLLGSLGAGHEPQNIEFIR